MTRGTKEREGAAPKARRRFFGGARKISAKCQRSCGRSRTKQSRRSCRAQELPGSRARRTARLKRKNVPCRFIRLRQCQATPQREGRRENLPFHSASWLNVASNGVETLEKLARPLECPLYQLFYDGEEPPKLPNLPKGKSSDDIAKTLATSTSFGGC